APHSVSAALFEGLRRAGGPAALHLAESPSESRFLATGNGDWAEFLRDRGLGHVAFAPPRTRPVPYVDGLGVLHERLVAPHAAPPPSAGRGAPGAVCPRSTRRAGAGIPPVPAMLEAGVRVCLGTDSLASVDDLDLLQDAAALHREFPDVAAEGIVRMATAGGAQAPGFRDPRTPAPPTRAPLPSAPAA